METVTLVLSIVTAVLGSPLKDVPNAIGGAEVESISSFPYQTALYSRYDASTKFCSGAILSSEYVITSAHCIVGSHSASIFYGSVNLAAPDFTKNQVVDAKNYRVHPQYSQYLNDVALILMNERIVFSGKRRLCTAFVLLNN